MGRSSRFSLRSIQAIPQYVQYQIYNLKKLANNGGEREIAAEFESVPKPLESSGVTVILGQFQIVKMLTDCT